MARIKFKVKSIAGKALADVGIVINLKNHGLVEKTTDENGETSISGVEVGSTLVSVSKEGFEGQNFSVEVNSEDQTVVKELVLLNTKKEVKVEEVVTPVALDVAKEVVNAYIVADPKSFADAKNMYKNLEKNIEAQKGVIEKALKDGAIEIVQQQASNLIYTAKTQLQKSMDYYVTERSKLNPLGSWVSFRDYMEMTSMIAGIYLLRQNLVKYTNELLEKVITKCS